MKIAQLCEKAQLYQRALENYIKVAQADPTAMRHNQGVGRAVPLFTYTALGLGLSLRLPRPRKSIPVPRLLRIGLVDDLFVLRGSTTVFR